MKTSKSPLTCETKVVAIQITVDQRPAIHDTERQGVFASATVRMESSLHLLVNCSSNCLPQRFPSSIQQRVINQ